MSAIALDPLIVEAKERARRRRLLGLVAVVVAAAAAGTMFALRSSGSSVASCAPAGFTERTVWNMTFGPQTIVLTNFRFGQLGVGHSYGFDSYAHWPAWAVTVALPAGSLTGTPARLRSGLRVVRSDFVSGVVNVNPAPTAYIATRSHGRVLTADVEVGAVTPATIAAANRALAGAKACSA